MSSRAGDAGVDRIALAGFVGAAVLAGGNAVAIKVGLRELPPLWSATLRFTLASVVLAGVMATLRMPWPRGQQLAGGVVYGAVGLGATFACANYALQTIGAGLGQTILALVPLATLLTAVAARQEHLTGRGITGSVVAALGVGVVYLRGAPEPIPTASFLAALGSVAGMSTAAVFVRRFPPAHPIAMNAVAVIVAAALLMVATVIAGESMTMPTEATTLAALAYLGIVGSVVVFTLMLLVLKHWSASRANYVMVLVPVVAIPAAALVLDEPVPATLLLGAVLVVGGVYLGALRGTWHRRPASGTPVDDAGPHGGA